MKYHDYHLRGYSVLEFGKRILLHLISDLDGSSAEETYVEFCDVTCYHFDHSCGAIVTDILEVELKTAIADNQALLGRLAAKHGLPHWDSGPKKYLDALKAAGKKAWLLESAIGFRGFVIAGEIREHKSSPDMNERSAERTAVVNPTY